jgi:hypothetical protein
MSNENLATMWATEAMAKTKTGQIARRSGWGEEYRRQAKAFAADRLESTGELPDFKDFRIPTQSRLHAKNSKDL